MPPENAAEPRVSRAGKSGAGDSIMTTKPQTLNFIKNLIYLLLFSLFLLISVAKNSTKYDRQIITFYLKQTQFAGKPKMNVTKALTKGYENKLPPAAQKTNPIKPNFTPNFVPYLSALTTKFLWGIAPFLRLHSGQAGINVRGCWEV